MITPVFVARAGLPSGLARAGITPISAAARRGRGRRIARTIEEEGVLIDLFPLVAAGRFARGGNAGAAGVGPLGRAGRRIRTWPTSRRRSPPTKPGGGSLLRVVALHRRRGGRGLHGACAGQRRGMRARGDRPAVGWGLPLSDGHRRARSSCRVTVDRASAVGENRFHRDQRRSIPATTTRRRRSARAVVLYVFRTLVGQGRSR